MEPARKQPRDTLSDLIDRLDKIREELLAVQRAMEKLEPAEPGLPE